MKPINETEIVGLMSRHDREVLGRGYGIGIKEMKYKIDKIKTEIQATIDEERTGNGNINKGVVIGLQMALDMVDKHISGKAESEE